MNEVRTEDELLPKPEKMGSFRTQGNRNPEINEINFKKLHA